MWGMGLSPLLILAGGHLRWGLKILKVPFWPSCPCLSLMLCPSVATAPMQILLVLSSPHSELSTTPGSPWAAFPWTGAPCPCTETRYSHNPVLLSSTNGNFFWLLLTVEIPYIFLLDFILHFRRRI